MEHQTHLHNYSPLSSSLNFLRAKFFRGNINIYLHFMSFLHTDMRRQDISDHDIELVKPRSPGPRTLRVKVASS